MLTLSRFGSAGHDKWRCLPNGARRGGEHAAPLRCGKDKEKADRVRGLMEKPRERGPQQQHKRSPLGDGVANLASAFTRFFLALRMERTPHPFRASRLANGEECPVLRSPAQGRPSIPLPEAPNPEAGACRCTNPANNFAAFSITPHSPGLRPLPKQQQAPLAVSSLDPMAQGHTVLPPYGSGLGRERAVFPRYYRSRPFSFYQCTESCDCQSTARTRGAVARPAGTAVRGWSERTAHCTN